MSIIHSIHVATQTNIDMVANWLQNFMLSITSLITDSESILDLGGLDVV